MGKGKPQSDFAPSYPPRPLSRGKGENRIRIAHLMFGGVVELHSNGRNEETVLKVVGRCLGRLSCASLARLRTAALHHRSGQDRLKSVLSGDRVRLVQFLELQCEIPAVRSIS